MSAPQRLTKKQKKALEFRARKGKGKDKSEDADANDIPVLEDQDTVEAEAEISIVENKKRGQGSKKKRDAEGEKVAPTVAVAKKRKRDSGSEEVAVADEKPKPKKKRKEGDVVGDVIKADGEKETDPKAETTKAKTPAVKQRFILFVGNLKYNTSKEAIEAHFAACDPPPTVRLQKPKPSALVKPTVKSKGFAFLEFTHRNALQQALKLHQSDLEGRKINVELTAGGGGKSENRLSKLQERNRQLHEQRKKQVEKQNATKAAGAEDVQLERPQRYSVTSGLEQGNAGKRTWTIGDPDEMEQAATRKRGKAKKHVQRDLGTGVNAIPVG